MKTSESIKEIAGALCKMQAQLRPADKDNTNPAFKSRYSDINSVWDALREPLTTNGLTAIQDVTTSSDGVSVITRVIHTSSEWIEFGPFNLPLGAKKDAQGFGSCVTYAKRYSICAALGITSSLDDDDGNAACAQPKAQSNYPNGDMSKDQAMQKLAKFNGDSIMILQFLLGRCDRFKTTLKDEVEMFLIQEEMAMQEFLMWKDAQSLKKKPSA